jgi:serine/threonine protein kinase
MDPSAFWVGPESEPSRYRLTHLLGSGGEGEVWRAVQGGTGHREVAVKIDVLPPGHDDGWQHRLASLASLRVTGLVEVEEAFVGVARHRADDELAGTPTHRYVVMNHVEGLTLRTWLDEHPDASPRRRIRILRGVAATLSSLHRGPGEKEPITHGDVKPTNIIIGSDGSPVLVDLGLLRPAGSAPASGRTAAYSSPELRNPDARPSPRADTFSFAVTAMETLTALTPPLTLDGTLDLKATQKRIATAPALRFRPLLRRQLLRSLVPEPDRRPATPVRVFAGRTIVLTVVPLLVILGVGGSAIAMRAVSTDRDTGPGAALPTFPSPVVDAPTSGPTTQGPTSSQGKRTNPSASPTQSETANPTTLVDDGKILGGRLSGGSSSDLHSNCDTRAGAVVTYPQHNLTAWGSERFSLTLTSDQDLRVLSVSRKRVAASAPTTLFQEMGITCPRIQPEPHVLPPHGCATGHVEHRYRVRTKYVADADGSTWHQAPTHDGRPFGVLDYKCSPPSELTLVADDCRTNVDYQVTVTYQLDSDPAHIYRRTFPTIHLRARVSHGTFVTSLEGLFQYPFPFSGGPDGCAHHGVSVTRPYPTVTDGIYVMLVKQIHDIRASHPQMTTRAGIDELIRGLEQGGTRYVPHPYTATDLLDVCQGANTNPTRWRGTCGPPDSPTPSPTAPAARIS